MELSRRTAAAAGARMLALLPILAPKRTRRWSWLVEKRQSKKCQDAKLGQLRKAADLRSLGAV